MSARVRVCTLVCTPACTRGAAGERAFPLPEPRQPSAAAAAADARPAPPPSQSPPPVALARPLPSPRSVGRLRECRAALRTRAPAAAAPARTERRARGARAAPSQLQSDDERRRGGRGEQVSASARLGGSEGEKAERGPGTAGPVDALQERLCPLRQPQPLPGSAVALRGRGRGLHSRPGIPAPAAQTKHTSAAAPAPRGHRAGGANAPPVPDCDPLSQARGLGGRHLGRAGGGGVAHRCPRGRRRRAAPEAARSGPGGGAYRRRCGCLRPRFSPRRLLGAAAAAGGPDVFTSSWWRRLRAGGRRLPRRAGRPAAPPCSPRVDSRASRLRGDSPPPRLGFCCPHLPLAPGLQLSGAPAPSVSGRRLGRALQEGARGFAEHCRRFKLSRG